MGGSPVSWRSLLEKDQDTICQHNCLERELQFAAVVREPDKYIYMIWLVISMPVQGFLIRC